MALRSRFTLAAVVLAMVLLTAPPAFAAKDGRYKGTDISFKVKNNRISKLKVVLTYSCQKIPTGGLPDGEVRSLNVPGKTKVSSKNKFKRYVYIGSNNGVTDIFFDWSGRVRGRTAKVKIEAGYTYSAYDADYGGFVIAKCYNTTLLKAKRV
jgi:hypothetical protein